MAETYKVEESLAMTRDGLRDIGYRDELLRTDYVFADVMNDTEPERRIDLAAFAQEPPSHRNACFGVTVPQHNGPEAIQRYLALGAPQIFALHPIEGEIRLWKMSAESKPDLIEQIQADQIGAKIRARKDVWNPDHILRAKSIGFTPGPTQLDFFDVGLVPVLEEIVQKKLDKLLRDVIASSKAIFTEIHGYEPVGQDYQRLFRLIFRLLAAKLLIDRQHEGFRASNDPQTVINDVQTFYFQHAPAEAVLQDKEIQSFAWKKIREAFHFQNVSVEALAYVYENTLVSAETRQQLDTHATPPEIAEYIVRQLPFEALAPLDRKVFEPFSGHAPFLIAALGRLRTLLPQDMSAAQRHEYFVRMLSGMEIDSFAREVARYSLILADYPNPDGWRIENDNVFSSPILDDYLSNAQVILCNPPYGDFTAEERRANRSIQAPNKAVEALRRVLQRPPKMLGFVLPRVFVNGQNYDDIRRNIALLYQNIELVVLPDNTFHHSDIETVLMIAHGERINQAVRRSKLVTKQDYRQFVHTGDPTWQTEAMISSAYRETDPVLWSTPLQQVWNAMLHLPHLSEVVDIHRGIEYKDTISKYISDQAQPGFAPGLVNVQNDFEPYSINSFKYLNTNSELMRRRAQYQSWNTPKVIANSARRSRGPWTITGAIDDRGLLCSQRFHGIWQKADVPLEVIAALMNGPIANAFISTQRTSRDNQIRVVKRIPVPRFTSRQIQSIVSLVHAYRSYRDKWLAQPDRADHFERLCRDLMWQIDAEVLAAYDLPPRLERELLDYFAGHQRPGPVKFDRYYPPDFRPAIPWHEYISEEFRGSTARKTLERLPVLNDPVISAVVEGLD